jgi:hypothetical protein
MPTPLKPIPDFFHWSEGDLREYIIRERTDKEIGEIAGYTNGTPLFGRYQEILNVAKLLHGGFVGMRVYGNPNRDFAISKAREWADKLNAAA